MDLCEGIGTRVVIDWHQRLICKGCGWHTELKSSHAGQNVSTVCPGCGSWIKNVLGSTPRINTTRATAKQMQLYRKVWYMEPVWYIKLPNWNQPQEYSLLLLKLSEN